MRLLSYTSHTCRALPDASECPPTYGAQFRDVRGFVQGGWATMRNHEGDLTGEGSSSSSSSDGSVAQYGLAPGEQLYDISLASFSKHVLPSLKPTDAVVVVALGEVSSFATPCAPAAPLAASWLNRCCNTHTHRYKQLCWKCHRRCKQPAFRLHMSRWCRPVVAVVAVVVRVLAVAVLPVR